MTVKHESYGQAVVFLHLSKTLQVYFVIRGKYVPLIWTSNTEFADKKTHFDWK